MADIHLEMDHMQTALDRLNDVVVEFNRAQFQTHEAADYVGHGSLAGKVIEFSDAWDIRRGKLTEAITLLGDSLHAIIETFEDLDARLGARLSGMEARAAANYNRAMAGAARAESSRGAN